MLTNFSSDVEIAGALGFRNAQNHDIIELPNNDERILIMTSPITVSLETYADADTYGSIIDSIVTDFAGQLLAVSINFQTPSSASTPLISVTFPDTPANRTLCADTFFVDSLDDFITN